MIYTNLDTETITPDNMYILLLPILLPSAAKRIATRILVITKLNEIEDLVLRSFVFDMILPSKHLPFEVSLLRTKKRKV